MAINLDRQNERVIGWADKTVGRLKGQSTALGITHRSYSDSPGPSVEKIKDKFKYQGGEISVVSFKFPRTLIWPFRGAGKGMGGSVGSTWRDNLGITHHTNPKSFGKM